jgi:oligopeptide/dipeptide ABC transporter ATP-binding protein
MKQRVCIAMALACKPALLLADEPTTALDVTVQAQILALLADLKRELGMALLLISHDLGVVGSTCDDVAVMYAGRIVERGPAARLLATPAHPYTRALLQSRPRLDRPMTPGARLPAIPGGVPDPRAWPSGCRFHPRCPIAREVCRADVPELVARTPDDLVHVVACPFTDFVSASAGSELRA